MPWWGFVAIAVAFTAGLAVGASVTVRHRNRLKRVREGVAELAGGNVAHRIIMPGADPAARMAVDVNTLADAIQAEREAARALDAAQRTLLANVSHDLRTPIASIAGYVDALQRGLVEDSDRYLAIIAAKTEELAQLTDDLFYEARLDSGDLELVNAPLDLAEAVRRAVLGFEPQLAGRGATVIVDVPEGPCPILADASAVARILGNLVANAVRHGREMTVFSISLADEDGRYIVRVSNDGAAMPQDAARIFERGVAGGGGGTGLGLAIARDLAERMDASLGFERTAGEWALFSLSFPAYTR